MKKFFVILGLCLLAGYIIFAALYFEEKPNDAVCNSFEIVATNDSMQKIINLAELEKSIDSKGLNPYGKQLKDVNTLSIEQAILNNQFIKSAEVYVTGKGGVKAVVETKTPILRVIPNEGESYYVDDDGLVMPLSKNLSVYLPLATGSVNKEFAQKDLYQFAKFLHNNVFWNAQIEQICVLADNQIELIPRVGSQKIVLGTLDNYESKLEKLYTFYQKGLNEVGWNRYAEINLKFDKQVVCTKR